MKSKSAESYLSISPYRSILGFAYVSLELSKFCSSPAKHKAKAFFSFYCLVGRNLWVLTPVEMVLTEEEFQSAEIVAKKDNRVNKYWSGRQRDGISLCEQACCDREIQQYLFHVHGHGHGNRRSSAYKCYNYIVHEIPFLNVSYF